MSASSHHQQQSMIRLLWSGILAVSMLCLWASSALGVKTEYVVSDVGRNGVAISVDMPLHVHSEHSLSLKRFFNRYNDQPKPAEPPTPVWALTANEFSASLPAIATTQHNVIQSPHTYPHQLQTLNAPRAPPLV